MTNKKDKKGGGTDKPNSQGTGPETASPSETPSPTTPSQPELLPPSETVAAGETPAPSGTPQSESPETDGKGTEAPEPTDAPALTVTPEPEATPEPTPETARTFDFTAAARTEEDKTKAASPFASAAVSDAGRENEGREREEVPPARSGNGTASEKKGASALTGALIVAAAVVLLLAAAALTLPMWRDQAIAALGGGAPAGQQAETEALRKELNQLASRVNALGGTVEDLAQREPAAPQAPANGPQIQELQERLSRLETAQQQAPAVDPQAVTQLQQANEDLRNQLNQTREQLAQAQQQIGAVERNSADAATVLRLAHRMDEVEQAARQAGERREAAHAMLLAVGQLREAVDRGAPFRGEMETIRALSTDEQALNQAVGGFATFADRGIPTRAQLQQRFQDLAGRIVQAGTVGGGDSWWDRTVDRMGALVSVRRIDGGGGGTGPASVVARAETHVQAGNLAAAVEELRTLQGAAAETAQPWIADAEARVAAERGISELTTRAVARSGAAG
ncbi:COG4223 family protein [Telmatospirillum sp. J64-1]|uniref:COG4223 family protein n=1 Tax=Telmatospirillum sp. J64-1 TaxID=2502183 RepID=UPI00115E0775|nr:mitofilin family membrane protein [Telmatospirillum sp. J64-1]